MSLALRRSVWGSLRSAPPFINPPYPRDTISERDQDTPPGARTMAFGRGKRASSARMQGKTIRGVPRTITMTAFDAEGRPPPPELDREVDLVSGMELDGEHVSSFSIFEILHPKQALADHSITFSSFPPRVKHLIYSFCFPDEHRKITLSPRFATKAVFDDEYFASPWDILDPVWGGLAASHEIRDELLTYFWTEYKFHVSVSSFSGPKLSPLSHVWLPHYLGIIQYLTIEADLTRFGGSALTYAASIGYECGKLERLMIDLVNGLKQRPENVMVAELIILSRKYFGNRPVDGVYVTSEEIPWHPTELLLFSDSIHELRRKVSRCRVAGFPDEYARKLLHSLFLDMEPTPNIFEPRDSAWPTLPLYEPPIRAPTALNAHSLVHYSQCGSNSVVTTRRSTYGTEEQPETPKSDYMLTAGAMIPAESFETAHSHSEWELTLHHSTSFTEMFEQEVNRSQESLSSNYVTDNIVDHEETLVEPFPQWNDGNFAPRDHAQTYQSLITPTIHYGTSTAHNLGPITRAPLSTFSEGSGQSLTENLRRHEDLSPKTTYSELMTLHNSSTELVSISRSSRGQEARLKSSLNACEPSTPTPMRRRGLPPSMSIMNALNEQDPAFIRTMQALRPREEATNRNQGGKLQSILLARPSMVETGDRCFSSMSTRSVTGVKKKYTSFFGRLRSYGSA